MILWFCDINIEKHVPFGRRQAFHQWAGTMSRVCKLKRGFLSFESGFTGRKNLKSPLTTCHLNTTEGKKRRFIFSGEAEVSKMFSLICMLRQR